MEYLYRVVYRIKPEFWGVGEDHNDHPWLQYITASNPAGRPYTTSQGVKGIVSTENNWSKRHNGKYEFKAQRFPLTQEWEDLDV